MRTEAALLAAVLFVSACGSENASSLLTPERPATTRGSGSSSAAGASTGGFPEAVVGAYLDGCTVEGEQGFCECTVREFEARLTLAQFLELQEGGLADRVILEVTDLCLEETGQMADPTDSAPAPAPVAADLETTTTLTVADLEEFWKDALPAAYGIDYQMLSDTIPYFPSSRDLPGCGPDPLPAAVYEQNAFYCSPGDFIAWDAEGLMPGLFTDFGNFAVSLVLAHEWGHAIQARARITGPTIMIELQADCFAGAWAAHVEGGGSGRLALESGDLDEGMAGYLLFRDPPGTPAADPGAHGSAFDRINAFQDGFTDGLRVCRAYADGEFAVVDIPLTGEDLITGGDLAFSDTAVLLVATLETFWSAAYPALFGTDYPPMTDYGPYAPSSGMLPPCGSGDIDPDLYEDNAFYCPPWTAGGETFGDYVAWDNESLFPFLWQEIGDMAVGMVLAHEWATGVQARAGLAVEGEFAELQADCLSGAWTRAMVGGIPITLDDGSETAISLSPGDLDEAVSGFLIFADRPGEDFGGSAFERFDAFQTGFFSGAEACLGA